MYITLRMHARRVKLLVTCSNRIHMLAQPCHSLITKCMVAHNTLTQHSNTQKHTRLLHQPTNSNFAENNSKVWSMHISQHSAQLSGQNDFIGIDIKEVTESQSVLPQHDCFLQEVSA